MIVSTAGREAALAQTVLAALDPHFNIHTEVWGTHPTGKRLRIDAIAIPRDCSEWARPDIALGIEFKAPTDRDKCRRDRKENAKIICQCIDYSLTRWDGFGYQPIFFCPGFAESSAVRERDVFLGSTDYHEGFKHGIGFLMQAVLGQSNVGELIHSSHLGWAFLVNGSHRVWSQRFGLGDGKRNKLQRSLGSR